MKKISFTARQPIFNKKGHAVAYELLFRTGVENAFPKGVNPHEATTKLIAQTHLNQGLDHVTLGRPAFINFTEDCLRADFPHMLPKDKVVIEVLETVSPSDEMYQKCVALYKMGYRLAFDDFVYSKEWVRFLKIAYIVKIDIQKTPLESIGTLISQLREKLPKLKLLAEKVETQDEFHAAAKMGFSYFQGYFFAKPEVIRNTDISPDEATLYKLFQLISKRDLNINEIKNVFETDVGLTYKLLMYVNSGVMPSVQQIKSIKHALSYLGDQNIRKLIAILGTGLVTLKKSREISRVSSVRAKASELLAHDYASKTLKKPPVEKDLSEDAFMAGMLSMIDAVLERPMEEILNKLCVSDGVKDALLNEKSQSTLRIIYNAILYAEQGEWHRTTKEMYKLNLVYSDIERAMNYAQEWSSNLDKVNYPT